MHAMNCHHGHKHHSLKRCYAYEQGFLSKSKGNKIFVEREIRTCDLGRNNETVLGLTNALV